MGNANNKKALLKSNKIHLHDEAPMKYKKKKPEYVTTGKTFGADKAFKKQVKKKLNKSISKMYKGQIVYCPITSRVGSDVEAAMDKVKNAKGIILVLMHHTRDPDYSTAGTNWSETIANVDLDVHVLFHESVPGLLKCSQNDKAAGQVVQFLKQNKKK